MSVRHGRHQVAGRPLPDEEVPTSGVSDLRRMRQRTIFEMCNNLMHEGADERSGTTYVPTAQDSIPWGDRCRTGKEVQDDGIFRVLGHNVNGISIANDHCDVRNFASALSDKSISLFGIQETNRNFARPHMIESMHRAIRGVSTHHHGAVASACMLWEQDYQPGGTAISVRNEWATRFLSKGSDDLGRWSWLTLTGRGTTKITFLSGYRVCEGASESPITSRTVRAQQEWIYADRGYTSINLRDQFVRDLIVLVNDFQAQGHDIVLMTDLNEPSGIGSAADRLCFDCNLIDAHTLSSDLSAPPPTYFRGSKKIDFMFLSPRISQCVAGVSILALHDGYMSDHRALLVDLDATSLFSGPTSSVVRPVTRRLTSTNPKSVHLYVQTLLRFIDKHQLKEKIFNLNQKSESGQWTQSDSEEWEQLDSLLVAGRSAAEKQCPRKNSGKHPWSPELARAGKTLMYWRMRLSALATGQVNLRMLDDLQQSLVIPDTDILPMSGVTLRSRVREARRSLKLVKKQAAILREDFLHEAASMQAALHGMSEDAACRAIAHREKSSKQFSQLRTIFHHTKASGLDRIDVPDSYAVLREGEATPRIPLVTKEEIEEVLVPHTEERFRQHNETPFGSGERKAHLGKDCTSQDAQNILDGSYDRDLDTLSIEAKEWLRQLQRKNFVYSGHVISTRITDEDWILGWAKMRESTASAPGGHYGHYKTSSVVARLPEDHPDHTRVLAELYAMMTSMPLIHGFAPRRWQRCIDAILEKIPGKPLIEKLRIIMLYEADFNFVLKLIWGNRLVRHAEKYKVLGTSNHGSRPG